MKIPVILLLFVMFFGTYLFADANAIKPPLDPSFPQVNLQLVLRNSEGQLVSYFQTDDVRTINHDRTHQFLDSFDNKILFEEDGIIYERIQWQKTEHFVTIQQPNIYVLGFQGIADVWMYHGPYLTEPGDTLTVSWDIIRIPP